MRRWFIIVTLWATLCSVQPANALQHDQYAVRDDSGILTVEEKEDITDYAYTLQQKTGAELAVIITPTTGEALVQQYAYDTFQQMQLGDAKEKNGLLLVMTTEPNEVTGESRQLYIEVGYGLEGALPDSKVGRMIDDIAMPFLTSTPARPNEAILNLYKALYNEVMIEYGLDGEQMYVDVLEGDYGGQEEGELPSWLIVIIVIIIVLVVSSGGGGSGRSGGRGGPPIFFPPSGGSSGGGGFSGGGFGGFGGGGSSGGGGAGRSW